MNTALRISFPAADAENAVAATLAAASSSRRVLNAFADVFLKNPAQRPISKQAAHRVRSSIPNDGLRTPQEVAIRLGMSVKQVKALALKDGELRFINTGRGTKNVRMMFTDADLNDFIERRATRNVSCPSTAIQSRRTTSTHSKSGVIGFTARRNAHRAGKPNK